MYSYKTEKFLSKKLKSIKKAVLKKEISFEDYKNCLFNQTEYFHRQKVIRSHKRNIFTEEVKNKSLSWKDDKRHLLPNCTDTLAYGHFLLVLKW
jgi:2-hydroxy-3-keto-5-methylthiopentenyl-1-phosphate phosphatase